MKRSSIRAWSRGKTPTIILFYWMNDDLASRKTEVISDERFEDITLRGITSDYDYIRNTSYRDPKFGLKGMQSTMRRTYIDDVSRKGTPKVAGRGAAMPANHTSSDKQGIRCFNCHKRGHRKSECTQPKQASSTSAAAGSAKTKWCSKHRSTTHQHTATPSAKRSETAKTAPTRALRHGVQSHHPHSPCLRLSLADSRL